MNWKEKLPHLPHIGRRNIKTAIAAAICALGYFFWGRSPAFACIGAIFGMAAPTGAAVCFSIAFALLFSYVRSRSNQAADTIIGVFSSAAVALGIFVATLGGGSFTKYNKYLIGDILSVTPGEIGMLALVLAVDYISVGALTHTVKASLRLW